MLKTEKIMCCGCGACYNVCPNNAIEMKCNKEGFLNPIVNEDICINCGKCIEVCPVLNFVQANTVQPVCYAAVAKGDIREKSTSGGAFAVFANRIIEYGGTVFGVAWKDDYSVYHCEAKDIMEISKFHGSKYIQSDTQKTFSQVKERLLENKKVLFSGTPCQIAGLYGYLGEKNKNLYTVEILCHGVPSQKTFNKYLEDNYEVDRIQDIKFVEKKKNKWRRGVIVRYTDGTESNRFAIEDSFFDGFYKNLYINVSCNLCKFNSVPRQADLTIADFWQIEQFDSELNDGWGTSMILINNEHGRKLFDVCADSFERLKEVPIEFIKQTVNKNVWKGFEESPMRKRFFDQFDTKKFNENVAQCINETYDIGLVGTYSVENFGGAVTYYALYCVLKQLGYSVLMIDRPRYENSRKKLDEIYCISPYEDYEIATNYFSKEQMYELNNKCEKFVVGSDQMFHAYIYQLFGRFASLNWVFENKLKVAIGASFGNDYFGGGESERAQLQYELQKFDAFSVREESGVKVAKEYFGIDAKWILDPIFLCEKKKIMDLVMEKELDEEYIGGYILNPDDDKFEIIQDVKQDYKLPLHIYGESFDSNKEINWNGIICKSGKIEERLRNIRDCKIFVTDSYHGMCLAIIMNKPFIAIINERRGKARFTSLCELLNLTAVSNYTEYHENKVNLKRIDWDLVNSIIEENRTKSIQWIDTSLQIKKSKGFSEKNILEKRLRTYGSFSHLGLEIGCTVQSIIDALPENSYIQQVQGKKGEPIVDTPAEYGVLTIKKTTKYFVEVQFVQSTLATSNPKLYIANLRNGKIDHWTSYAEENELQETKRRVEELEKDVKFLIRKYVNSLSE